jgi:hypothetical protein
MTNTAPALTLRRLDTPAVTVLVESLAIFEDLQMVLKCCERLMADLKVNGDARDELAIEAVWTVALNSYARCFTARPSKAQLTEDDLKAAQPHGEVGEWHKMLLLLQKHYSHQIANPRERFTIGAACDDDGQATGIGVTSARQPQVDSVTVRQTGAIAFSLSELVDKRITAQQETVFLAVSKLSVDDLAGLPVLNV